MYDPSLCLSLLHPVPSINLMGCVFVSCGCVGVVVVHTALSSVEALQSVLGAPLWNKGAACFWPMPYSSSSVLP
jgi:hypothetical protein